MTAQKTKIIITTKDVISIPEAAKELGVDFSTIYRWIKKGEINAVRIGNHMFLPIAELKILKKQRASETG